MTKVTMNDVAISLNTTKATVSRALNDKGDISEEMKKKVREKCNELGYKINHNAQALSTKKNKTIGILASEILGEKGEFFYKEIYTNIVIELEKRGYTTILKIVSQKDIEKRIEPDFLQRQMADGLLILGEISRKYIDILENYEVATVLIDFDLGDLKYDSIVTNNVVSISKVTSLLIGEGYKNIAFVGNDNLTSSIFERFWGYKMEMKKYDLPTYQICEKSSVNDEPCFNEEDILKNDAFICNNDYTAYKLIEYLKELGQKVPTDKRVIGFDNTFYSDISTPKISTVDVKRELFASEAIRLLFSRMENRKETIKNISLNAEYVNKES